MKTMPARRIYAGFALLGLLAGASFGGDSAMDRATLRGIKAVKVVVDPPDPELEREGIDRERLRTSIELQLRNARIKIDPDALEFLGVSFPPVEAGRKSRLAIRKTARPVAVGLGVYQLVLLSRDKETKTVAETWGQQRVVSAAGRDLEREVSSAVEELVDQFVRAYRAVNP
jgi:hypothetical protein